jgi:general secretion pathway protein D
MMNRSKSRLRPMSALRMTLVLALAGLCLEAADPSAGQVARLARDAQKAGLLVRAWELYSEAARMDPSNASYRTHRDVLAANAAMLTQFGLEKEDKSLEELKSEAAAEPVEPDAEAPVLPALDPFEPGFNLLPPPSLKPFPGIHSFDSRGDEKGLYTIVARAFGFKVVFDPAFDGGKNLQFHIENVDLRDSLEALTAATNTFVFPTDSDTLFVARDNQQKRLQYEPQVALTILVPEAADPKDVTEAATAVKGLLQSQRVMIDASARTVVIRDIVSKAYLARALLESLLLPRAQVSLEFQLLALDESVSNHYGIALPTSYPILNFGKGKYFQRILNIPAGFTNFLAFGGGATLFGIGIADTNLFATSSKSWTRAVFDGSLVAGNGQPVHFHVGDKYPIAQALSTGFSQGGEAQVVPQTTQEDLGIEVKATPHIFAAGEIGLDVEVTYKTLGDIVLNTVPSVNIREFKGSIHLEEGQLAVIAGMDSESLTETRNGIIGLADVPWVNQFLAENTRGRQTSRSMIVLKPVLMEPPAFESLPLQFTSSGDNGPRVLL